MIHYFAYGSNMDEDDFKKRYDEKNMKQQGYVKFKFHNPRPAKLNHYKLRFNYCSGSRGGGVANIMESREDFVYGLLFDITDEEFRTISKKESPKTYNEICVDVEQLFDGKVIHDVKTHKVFEDKQTEKDIRPTKYYLQLIVKNAKKYNFPKEYIEYLESFPTKKY